MIRALSKLFRKPVPQPFPWRGDLEACRQHCLAKWAKERSEAASRGHVTRATRRVGA